jgi:hypothetical protein
MECKEEYWEFICIGEPEQLRGSDSSPSAILMILPTLLDEKGYVHVSEQVIKGSAYENHRYL